MNNRFLLSAADITFIQMEQFYACKLQVDEIIKFLKKTS